MIVLVIRKSDGTVMPPRQNSPRQKPGRMTQVVCEKYGGVPNDYMEFIVDPKDEKKVIRAKELLYNPIKKAVEIVSYTAKEVSLRQKRQELVAAEKALIKAHLDGGAAFELGLDTEIYTEEKEAAQELVDELNQQIIELENTPDGNG